MVVCAVAAGFLLVTITAVTIGGYLLVARSMDEVKTSALDSFAENFARYEREGRLDGERRTVFAELLALSRRDETSFMVVAICEYLLEQSVEGTADPQRQQSTATAVELRALMNQNPRAGLTEMSNFITDHPQLKAHFLPEPEAVHAQQQPPVPWQKSTEE